MPTSNNDFITDTHEEERDVVKVSEESKKHQEAYSNPPPDRSMVSDEEGAEPLIHQMGSTQRRGKVRSKAIKKFKKGKISIEEAIDRVVKSAELETMVRLYLDDEISCLTAARSLHMPVLDFLEVATGETHGGYKDAEKFKIILEWSDDDSCYVTTVPDLPGCKSDGSTPEQAIKNTYETIQAWLGRKNVE